VLHRGRGGSDLEVLDLSARHGNARHHDASALADLHAGRSDVCTAVDDVADLTGSDIIVRAR